MLGWGHNNGRQILSKILRFFPPPLCIVLRAKNLKTGACRNGFYRVLRGEGIVQECLRVDAYKWLCRMAYISEEASILLE